MSPAASLDSRAVALADPAATLALGARLASVLTLGDVVCLSGGLGAGKTTLARGAIQAWTGQAEEAPSPTYTLVQIYEGARGPLWHVDLYRLKRAEEAYELGLEEAFASAVSLVEWPERLEGALPRNRLEIALEQFGAARRAILTGHGDWRARVDAI